MCNTLTLSRTECEIANEETAIKELREKLKDAMQDRKNKEEYDLVAEQIVKIPSRQQSQRYKLYLYQYDFTIQRFRRIKSLIAEQQALESISEAQLNLVEMRRSKLKVLFEEMEQLRTEFENNKSADESYSQIAGDDYEDEQQQQNAAAVNNEDE